MLDTACARLALGQNATPPAIEDARRQLDDLEVQERVLGQESKVGADHVERLAAIAETKEKTDCSSQGVRGALQERERTGLEDPRDSVRSWKETASSPPKRLLNPCRETEPLLRRPRPLPRPHPIRRFCAKNWRTLKRELAELQGENPLMRVCVDAHIVGEVISGWTGIPIGKMLRTRSRPC